MKNNIQFQYGIARIDATDERLAPLIKSMLKCIRKTENQFKRSRWNLLAEIYYFLTYGLVGHAWIKINNLRDDLRWKVPGDVYNTLKDLCEDMEVKIV